MEITPQPNPLMYVGKSLAKHLQEHIKCTYGISFDDNQQLVHMRIADLAFDSGIFDSYDNMDEEAECNRKGVD
ncbi:hypothetical protein PIB30_039878 [Stylosanthes scabra]|uniref:Uncharacterized protein n=1 Tax=Stylosanthes scabra TaxID=79078 RepID=A0ABU6WET9_9FABA|nr:hypothetical protein [Stylosanthes scabra]